MAKLTINIPDQEALVVDLSTQDQFTIGRRPDLDITVSHASVSGSHAVITKDGEGYKITDQGSTNGTFLADERITEKALSPGVELKLGFVPCTYEGPATAAEPPAAAAPSPAPAKAPAAPAKAPAASAAPAPSPATPTPSAPPAAAAAPTPAEADVPEVENLHEDNEPPQKVESTAPAAAGINTSPGLSLKDIGKKSAKPKGFENLAPIAPPEERDPLKRVAMLVGGIGVLAALALIGISFMMNAG